MAHRVLAAGTIAAIGLLAGCGDDGEAETQTSEVVDPSTDALDAVPLVPRSEPFGRPSAEDGVQTRSYEVDGTTPERIIAFYADALPAEGWTQVEPTNREDTEQRADFVDEDHRLEISAIASDRQASEDDAEGGVQYSLVLRPL